LEVFKSRFPEFKVKVGLFAQVDTPLRARFWEDLGADAINLESFSINRDFERLTAIRAAVRCDLQLIANHCCLPNCPMQSYHQNGFAHSSDGSRTLFMDYCFKQPVQRSRFWFLSYFFKPFQVSLGRLWPLLQLVRSQGMLFPKQQMPIHIDAAQIPTDFLKTFRHRDCASGDCGSCAFCEKIGQRAVRIDPEFRRVSLDQFCKVHDSMTSGDLWNIPTRSEYD
jgi:hypothetical protein